MKNFDISDANPDFLKVVFELEALPNFLETETGGTIVPIMASKLVPNEHYIIRVPGHEAIEKNTMAQVVDSHTSHKLNSGLNFFLLYNVNATKIQI